MSEEELWNLTKRISRGGPSLPDPLLLQSFEELFARQPSNSHRVHLANSIVDDRHIFLEVVRYQTAIAHLFIDNGLNLPRLLNHIIKQESRPYHSKGNERLLFETLHVHARHDPLPDIMEMVPLIRCLEKHPANKGPFDLRRARGNKKFPPEWEEPTPKMYRDLGIGLMARDEGASLKKVFASAWPYQRYKLANVRTKAKVPFLYFALGGVPDPSIKAHVAIRNGASIEEALEHIAAFGGHDLERKNYQRLQALAHITLGHRELVAAPEIIVSVVKAYNTHPFTSEEDRLDIPSYVRPEALHYVSLPRPDHRIR